MADLSDAEFATFVDRVINCRKAEDDAKADTKQVYAEAAEKGIDKAGIGALVRSLRMDEKQASKAQMRDALVDDYRERYRRGRASHVRARVSASYAEAKGREPVQEMHKLPEGEATQEQPETASQSLSAARNSANTEHEDVDGSTERAGHAGRSYDALSGQVETRNSDNSIDGNASLAAREGEQAAALNSQSATLPPPGDADKAEADSSSPVSATIPALVAQRIEQEVPNLSVAGSNPAERSTDDFDPSKLSFLNDKPKKSLRPNCLHPELCASGFPREHCHACKKAMAESEAA